MFGWFRGRNKAAGGEEPPQAAARPEAEEEAQDEAEEEERRERRGFFRKLRECLSHTRDTFVPRLDRLVLGKRQIDDELLDELEEILITSDLGVHTTQRLIDAVKEKVQRRELRDADRLKEALRAEIADIVRPEAAALDVETAKPFVIMVVGVNGVGKTTTIGKIASQLTGQGKRVLLVAADTFRAAAAEQLEIWAKRSGSEILRQKSGADPSAVAFDGIKAALARGTDVVLIDTAGRLHTKVPLMEEVKKIRRITARELEGAPHEVLLVLDSTTGQNAISQAKMFHESLGLTGLALTKLDGTSKGGVVVAIADELKLPIRFVGVGEQVDDLKPFVAEDFVAALFGANEGNEDPL
ncbi:MAG: signal recognition particle-docking protein FtsY [Pseudomonadota bacterium]